MAETVVEAEAGVDVKYSITPSLTLDLCFPPIFTQSLIQYNSLADLWSANIRLGWLQQANTGLFLVYNEVHRDGLINNRSFTIKYTRMFDILR
ncbi:MAG TPA: hypothetical protein VJ953_17460 [Saprospiraceae bacterium]|nr:hypothetical protein [Saprospiraceae bacterium]